VRIEVGGSVTVSFKPGLCVVAVAGILGAALASAQSSDIPIVAGVNVVLAVENATSGASAQAPAGILQGDYEMLVAITGVGANGVNHMAAFDGTDAAGVQRRGNVSRLVSAADLASAPVQILGFHIEDPPQVTGATALGPSLAVVRDLVQKGSAAYSFRLWAGREVISGTLRRSSSSPVKFPVLLNGKRVELDGIHATGQMALGNARRPFETVILNHPRYPISLRIAYGPRDGGFPFKPEFAREVVRIDLPVPQDGIGIVSGGAGGDGRLTGGPMPRGTGSGAAAVAGGPRLGGGGTGGGTGSGSGGTVGGKAITDALDRECRVELSGIYFDFNQATIKPESERALKEIAAALKGERRRIAIEGHTDNIGTDRYNDDLSARRAAAVKAALVRDHGVDEASLTTAGYGERRPIETNDTLSGRARNRRVELVCAKGR
jgi:outer membrane protein OmpA-like peptidoglycan-associated protein